MSRPDCDRVEPDLSAWLDGVLPGRSAQRVAAHLAVCSACRSEVDSLRATRVLLRAAPLRRLPVGVRATLVSTAVPTRPSGTRGVPVRPVAFAATALLALGVTAFAVGDDEPAPPTVTVPLEVFVADHLVRTVDSGVATPPLPGASR